MFDAEFKQNHSYRFLLLKTVTEIFLLKMCPFITEQCIEKMSH